MTKAVFDNIEGDIYVNDIDNINFCCIILKTYCFIAGQCNKNNAYDIFTWLPNEIKVINADEEWFKYIESFYNNQYEIYMRYVMDIPIKFNINLLTNYINRLDLQYKITNINEEIYYRIKNTDSFCTNIGMSIDYFKNGIGVCCIENDEIIGIATSNIFYNNGIEINIKVNPEKRRKGIASAISSKLILECLKKGKIPYWDAANDNSLGLAKKLGYTEKCKYKVYYIKRK